LRHRSWASAAAIAIGVHRDEGAGALTVRRGHPRQRGFNQLAAAGAPGGQCLGQIEHGSVEPGHLHHPKAITRADLGH